MVWAICIGSFDATVRIWDCKSSSMKPIQVLEEARDSVSSLHVVGHEIVTGCVDGRVRVYDLRMGMLFVDVIGRMYRVASFFWEKFWFIGQGLLIPICYMQNLSLLSDKPAMAMLFWFRRWILRFGLWIRGTDNCCRVTRGIAIQNIGLDRHWVWQTQL